ncbi:maltose alpha-D-glucosyltransferase [Methylocella sp.]|uniref:maltose alpha-D-glucosyltransferase n=1 Tax=Methylocella sp. TaxID=1978226 RepID=UPI0037844387
MIDRSDVRWYRDAIIYQLHVKSFFDSDNDGVGDFAGLTQKLDYVKDLGATAIWLMPFYPSPLRDDGYDISNYRDVNAAYGSLRDFKAFVREAHQRNLRVIIELVVNHTSDQHPWFQRARAAKPGSAARNFYVWSGTDQKYKGVPVIFCDIEKSNWSYDEVAGAYYWHRFYAHQPDLNYDNPKVIEAVLDVMRFWLDMGVDGLRLDAVPYLVERDGTPCENLPETHAIIRKIRAAIDADYPDRMLLAEANVWPEEAREYFGDGDECHMAFNFPLMPRIYMALAQEDRHPITDILRQTPDLPEGGQWAIFLRNHDEMTLAMVTDKERDYLWSFYAADKRARINLGIRRRLAPLLEKDRRKIELLNSLLFSMPGTPVVYYGDEIGMGDNIYLGDRDGVRTPMQWSVDRNGGFSRADPARLFLPAIQDPVYGFYAVNVEAQLASPSSLLTWTRRMIAVRRSTAAFGRGTLRFLYPANRKTLAYLRESEDERILCVVNVSRAPQAVELDLSEFRGAQPVEMTAGSEFPPIGELPYMLTLPAYGFYWFRLEPLPQERGRLESPPELFTLVAVGPIETIFSGRELTAFERDVAPQFLRSRRWFPAGLGRFTVALADSAVLVGDGDGEERRHLLALLDVKDQAGERAAYFTPLAAEREGGEGAPPPLAAAAKLRRGAQMGLLYDAESCPPFARAMLEAFRAEARIATRRGGEIVFSPFDAAAPELAVAAHEVEELAAARGHSTLVLDKQLSLKIVRRLEDGERPDLRVRRFLTQEGRFPNTPRLLGVAWRVGPDGTRQALASLETFTRCQGDAWTWTLDALKRILEAHAFSPASPDAEASPETPSFSTYMPHMQRLGLRTAQMHQALTSPTTDAALAAEPLTQDDLRADVGSLRAAAERVFDRYEEASGDGGGSEAERLLDRREEMFALLAALDAAPPVGASKICAHGDYRLAHALVVKDDVIIVGFRGGAPGPGGTRVKASPLRDVATMIVSFAKVVAAAERAVATLVPDPVAASERLAENLVQFSEIFVDSYMSAVRGGPAAVEDRDTRRRLLVLHMIGAAFEDVEAPDADEEKLATAAKSLNAILDRAARMI